MEMLCPVKKFEKMWKLSQCILIQLSLIFRNHKDIKKELSEIQNEAQNNLGNSSEV